MQVFGWEINKKKDEEKNLAPSPVTPQDDGGYVLDSDYFGRNVHAVDFDSHFREERDLILQYRDVANHPEVDKAIEEIIAEAIVTEEDKYTVELNLESVKLSDSVKKKIQEEFQKIIKLLDFDTTAHDIFKQWYIDGRLYYQKILHKNPKEGILELRRMSPLHTQKVKEVIRERDKQTNIEYVKSINEYFLYRPHERAENTRRSSQPSLSRQLIKMSKDSVCHVTSGLYDENREMALSFIDIAIKPINQLRMLEDAVVIYRLARAPERRIFYIDVGNLPKTKAEQHMKSVMDKYRNRITYDAISGKVKDTKNQLSMMEDFWLPRREGKSTEVTTLAGAQQLGEIDDVVFFQKKMYTALRLPLSRLEPGGSFALGRAAEISRDEVKFSRFIGRIRRRFSDLFYDILRTQLLLKKIVTPDEWYEMSYDMYFDFNQDSFFNEFKQMEMERERLGLLREQMDYAGKFYSMEWLRRNTLKQNDDDIKLIDKQIKDENAEGEIDPATMPFYGGSDNGGQFDDEEPGGEEEPPPQKEPPQSRVPEKPSAETGEK